MVVERQGLQEAGSHHARHQKDGAKVVRARSARDIDLLPDHSEINRRSEHNLPAEWPRNRPTAADALPRVTI